MLAPSLLQATRARATLTLRGNVVRAAGVSTWGNVPAGPPDPILGEFRIQEDQRVWGLEAAVRMEAVGEAHCMSCQFHPSFNIERTEKGEQRRIIACSLLL